MARASAILVSCTDPAQQEDVAARIKERFPDDQIIFTRDLPEIYASGVPALNVFIKVVVGGRRSNQHAGDSARHVHHRYRTNAANRNH